MPALLDILSQDKLEKHRVFSSAAVPLLFRFSHGCRRAGVFCCLVVHLMKECKWSIQHENGDLILVARNCIKFRLPESYCLITLIDAFYFIEVHIDSDDTSLCRKVCPTVQKKIIAGINAACEKLQYSNDHPHLAVFCPCCTNTEAGSSKTKERHAAVLKESKFCFCIETSQRAALSERHRVWLEEESQGTPSTST